MFNKNKRKYNSRIAPTNGFSISGNYEGLNSDEILHNIQSLFEKHGRIVINYIDDDDSISVTSLKTVYNDSLEYKLEEIKDDIRKIVTEKFK